MGWVTKISTEVVWVPALAQPEKKMALRWTRNSFGVPVPPRGFVWLVHGLGEHGGRYQNLANFLARLGFDILIPDLPGHGLTAQQGRWRSLEVIPELVKHLEHAQSWWTLSGPLQSHRIRTSAWYLAGHSMGALAVLAWLTRGPTSPRTEDSGSFARCGFVSAAPLGLRLQVPKWKLGLAHLLNKYAPDLGLGNEIRASELSRNLWTRWQYDHDLLVHSRVTPRLYFSMLEAAAKVLENPNNIEIPLCLTVGEADPIVEPETLRKFYSMISTHKKWVSVPDARHEILFEWQAESLWATMASWFLEAAKES